MNILTINTCPLCNSPHLEQEMSCKDYYATGEEFELFQCEKCGFLFTQGAPVEAEIGRYYESPDYISHSDTKKGAMNGIYHRVRKRMLAQKAQLIIHTTGKKKGKILDIGTGTGYFANSMKEKGWEVEAIEKSTTARDFAKEHFALEVKDHTALAQMSGESFDAITLWHVMEHLEHINETWKKLYELLNKEGVLVIAVPNCTSYDAKKYEETWAAYDVPRHLWHFTPNTMQQFGSAHGFALMEMLPMPYDAFYVSMLSEKYNGSSISFLKGALTGTAAWFSTLGNKERSSSIIYIFKKVNNGK